jgi:hypothetical protein
MPPCNALCDPTWHRPPHPPPHPGATPPHPGAPPGAPPAVQIRRGCSSSGVPPQKPKTTAAASRCTRRRQVARAWSLPRCLPAARCHLWSRPEG